MPKITAFFFIIILTIILMTFLLPAPTLAQCDPCECWCSAPTEEPGACGTSQTRSYSSSDQAHCERDCKEWCGETIKYINGCRYNHHNFRDRACECVCGGDIRGCGTNYTKTWTGEEPGAPFTDNGCLGSCKEWCGESAKYAGGCRYSHVTCHTAGAEEAPAAPGEAPAAPGEAPPPEKIELQPPFGQAEGSPTAFIQKTIGVIIKWALGIVGSIALLMFVFGGFMWLTAAGNPDNIKKGKGILVWAAIGLVAIFAAYAVTQLIFTALTSGT